MSTNTQSGRATNGGLRGAARLVAEHASSIVRLELELAALEVKKKIGSLGIGVGLLVASALVGMFAIAFAFATIAAVLATFLATWLALLAVTLGLLAATGLLALLGIRKLKKGSPPVPEQAIREARLTSDAIKSR
jgi:Putative Actinobacterial Holin-X, holin superfamily III